MPDATITSTASTFGTISGTFLADQSTVTGTVAGTVVGTLSGSVGVPGPQGPTGPQGPEGPEGPPGEGGTWGSIVGTLSAQGDLWTALGNKYDASNPSGYQTAAQVTSALSPYLTSSTASATYYPLSNPSGYITASAIAGYATEGWVGTNFYPISGNPSGFLTSASLSGYATESWVTGQGYLTSAALTPYLLSSTAASTYYLQTNPAGYQTASQVTSALSPYLLSSTAASTYYPLTGNPSGFLTSADLSGYALLSGATFTGTLSAPTPSPGTDSTVVATTEWVKQLEYAPLNAPQFTGNPRAPTPNLADNDTSIATTEFVKGQGYITSLALTGYATESWVTSQGYLTDAPSDGSQYARKNGAWDVVSTGTSYISSVSSPLAVASGNLTVDLSAYLTTSAAASTYSPIASPTFTGLATFDNPGNYAISIPGSGTGYDIRIEGQVISMRNAGTEVIRIGPGGIKYPDGVTQSVAYPGSSGFLLKADNLSGLANTATARTNLGLGTMAVETASNYLTTATAASTYQTLSGMSSYLTTSTAASTYQTISGMSSYLTTSAAASTYFTIANAANKADLASPTFTGVPAAPTASPGTNTTQLATTAFVTAAVSASTGATWGSITGTLSSQTDLQSALDAKLSTATAASTYAPLASPALTGNPTAPTPLTADNDTSIATTAFVKAQGYLTSAPVTSVAGRTGAVTLSTSDISGLGTMATATAADYSTTTVANGLYYPLASNPAGYLTTAPVTSVAGRTGAITLAVADVSGAAPLASPALAGTPTAPTATAGTNTTQIATTAFVNAAIPTNNVKAWVNFNGTGTVAIRASMNVSSITDNGAGDYTVNFTTAISDANYGYALACNNWAGNLATIQQIYTVSPTTTAFRVRSNNSAGGLADSTGLCVTILR